MNRSDGREPSFTDEADRRHFVATLGEGCAKTGRQVHADGLMPNHFHLVVETPQPSLVTGMRWFGGTYRSQFNRRQRLLGEDGAKESPAGRQPLERALEAQRGAEAGEEFKGIRRGGCVGEEAFGQELLVPMSERLGTEHDGKERAATEEARAQWVIAEEWKRRRWQETEWRTRPEGGPANVALAAWLRAEATLTVGWIAARLEMGRPGYLHHLLRRRRNSCADWPLSRTDPYTTAAPAEELRRGLAIIKN